MKKIFFLAVLLVSILIIPVSAANVGDKISEAVYTDIVAYVNNYPMPAYVIDGYAVIVAEDLRDYCCDVVYDEATRSLYITKAGEDATFSNKLVYKPNRETGEYYTDVLYTDIKTYVNGNEVKSFNVNGKTMIVIDEFGKYMDGYEWDSVNRAALSYLADKPMAEFKPVDKRIEVLFDSNKNYFGKYYDDYDMMRYSVAYDLNFDGVPEGIEFVIDKSTSKPNQHRLKIRIGRNEKEVEYIADVSILLKVLVLDMDSTDGVKDVAIQIGDIRESTVRIFKAGDEIEEYKFQGETVENHIVPHMGTKLMIDMYEDEFFISQTTTCGNIGRWFWPVIYTYEKSETDNMLYIKKEQAKYRIETDDYMRSIPFMPDWEVGLQGEDYPYEKEMWKKGYIKVGAVKGYGITLENEYVRVLYDNGVDCVYVEKLNGEGGWIYVYDDGPNWSFFSMNPYF